MYAYSRRGKLSGNLTVPGSKSHTIRAVMLSALAQGESVIRNPLLGKDGLAAVAAARAYGAKVNMEQDRWIIEGVGGCPKAPACVIDTMNSGTTTSFSIGVAGLVDGHTVVTGDEQICSRPWKRQTEAMTELGATCLHTRPESECPPVVIGGKMKGGICRLDGFNSQHISGILLPSPLLEEGQKTVIEVEKPLEQPYIQMTIDWIKRYGAKLQYTPDYKHFEIEGGQQYKAQNVTIPADWSGVAFPLVAAVCTESELTIDGVDFFDSQGDKAVVDILISMGADIVKDEKAGKLIIKGAKPLNGVTVDLGAIPDSLPALSVAAAFANGDTVFTNLAHVRVKESDRVAVMSELLTACGASVEITADKMTVHGGKPLHGSKINSRGDHRIAMAMAVCGLLCDGVMEISEAECASVSFPNFYETLNRAGAGFEVK